MSSDELKLADAPPDGGPWLFAASYLALPLFVGLGLFATRHAQNMAEPSWPVLQAFAPIVVGGLWVCWAHSAQGLHVRAVTVGAASAAILVIRNLFFTKPDGDDVLALGLFFFAPILVAIGATFGMMCAGVVIVAFRVRQRPRAQWLESAIRVGDYQVVRLGPGDAKKPMFLRYRDEQVGLAKSYESPSVDHRSSGETPAVVARIPRQIAIAVGCDPP